MTKNRTHLLLAPLAASALVLSLAACGSDDDSSESSATTEASAEATTTPSSDMTEDTAAGDMAEELPGGEATVGDITVTEVWLRQPAEGQPASAAYGIIANAGDADVTLIGGSVPFDATVEIHETLMSDDGVMQMQEREGGFVVPAGGTFTLEPGGPHVMLLDIDPADIVGSVDVTMIFDDGTEVTVTAPVRELAGMGMEPGGMESGESGMTGTTMAGG